MSTSAMCDGCKHAVNPQSYFHMCDNPQKLEQYKRFYYVERHPDGLCRVEKEATVENTSDS